MPNNHKTHLNTNPINMKKIWYYILDLALALSLTDKKLLKSVSYQAKASAAIRGGVNGLAATYEFLVYFGLFYMATGNFLVSVFCALLMSSLILFFDMILSVRTSWFGLVLKLGYLTMIYFSTHEMVMVYSMNSDIQAYLTDKSKEVAAQKKLPDFEENAAYEAGVKTNSANLANAEKELADANQALKAANQQWRLDPDPSNVFGRQELYAAQTRVKAASKKIERISFKMSKADERHNYKEALTELIDSATGPAPEIKASLLDRLKAKNFLLQNATEPAQVEAYKQLDLITTFIALVISCLPMILHLLMKEGELQAFTRAITDTNAKAGNLMRDLKNIYIKEIGSPSTNSERIRLYALKRLMRLRLLHDALMKGLFVSGTEFPQALLDSEMQPVRKNLPAPPVADSPEQGTAPADESTPPKPGDIAGAGALPETANPVQSKVDKHDDSTEQTTAEAPANDGRSIAAKAEPITPPRAEESENPVVPDAQDKQAAPSEKTDSSTPKQDIQ